MRNKKPPFEITEAALSEVMEISELVGKISSTQNLSTSPILRRQNRIRTIYSSLAIEQNTLSLEQVTAVLSGKRVLAPPKDIAEVKNAYEIYDHLAELNPYSMDDLLLAHRTMMQGLVREAGEFRSRTGWRCGQQGQCPAFWNIAAVRSLFDGGTDSVDRKQSISSSNQELRFPL